MPIPHRIARRCSVSLMLDDSRRPITGAARLGARGLRAAVRALALAGSAPTRAHARGPAHRRTPPAGRPRRAPDSRPTPPRSRKPRCTATRCAPSSRFRRCRPTTTSRAPGLYSGEPFSYLWPFSQALAATVSMANIPGMPVSFAPEIHARLVGLRSYLDTNNSGAPEGTFTSTLAAFDGTVAPPDRPGRHQVLRRQRLGRDRARAPLQADPQPGALGYAEGIMAFEMAGWQADPELACPGASRSQTPPKTPIATPSPPLPRRSWGCSSTGSPATSSICSSPRWPTNGCAAACCSPTVCTPTTSARTASSTRRSGATTRER